MNYLIRNQWSVKEIKRNVNCEWWRHIHTQIRTNQGIAVLAWLQQCIRNKVSLISEAHVQYTTFFWFSLLSRSENRKPQSAHTEQNTWITFSRLSIIEGHRGFTLCIKCMCSAYFFVVVVPAIWHYNVLNKFWVNTFLIYFIVWKKK